MPPKRNPAAASPQPCGIDFRASDDDGWYGVQLCVERGDGDGRRLRVMYCDFPEVCDETFTSGGFADEEDLEEFSRRFRASSGQLQDWECGEVVEGMTVCASYAFGEGDVRFYDAVVEEVCFSDHKIIEGDEVCTCTFVLLWQHGPNAGRKTSTGIEHVCLLKQRSKLIDPALDLFLELSRKSIKSAGQGSCKFYIILKLGPGLRFTCVQSLTSL
uniref:Phosphoribosylaminoimidazole-succinocarboxamide synthase n=1 Tax=Anthurium amnicola TaxID=1678845 RepID=A0A1D1XR38_9ARAE